MSAGVKVFGCRPITGDATCTEGRRPKTRKGGNRGRKVKLSWAPGKVIGGEDYLLQMTIPNTFFHVAMAYAILRHNGVDVGKMDFLGAINLVDA